MLRDPRAARALLVVPSLVSLLACSRESGPPSKGDVAPAATTSSSASAAPASASSASSATSASTASSSAAAAISSSASAEDAGPPPSARFPATGDYRVEVSVVSDDCAVKYTPPKPWEERVFAGAKDRQAKANIRMVAIPPSNATDGPPTNRSDVVFEPRKPWKATFMPLRQCPAYQTAVANELKAADPSGFTIVMTVEHGDATSCPAQPPSKCTTKIERRYALVKHLCKPECTFGTKPPPSSGAEDASAPPEVDCRC